MLNTSLGLARRSQNAWKRPLLRSMSSNRTRNNKKDGKQDRNTAATKLSSHQESSDPFIKKGFQPTGFTRDGVYMGSTFLTLSPHTLPEIDVSPFLDTRHYGRIKGYSINGNDAAIRLTQAKRKLRRAVHDELHGKNAISGGGSGNNIGRERRLYILRNTGVPNQLLQHLLVAADKWLQQKAALELRVDHSDQNTLSVVTAEGGSWETLWPTSSQYNYDFHLYHAIMTRMVQSLGTMVPKYDEYVLPDDWAWKVSISRRDKLPVTLFPRGSEVMPVIEWEIPEKDVKERKVVIRLQGAVNPREEQNLQNLKKSHDVSLIFEASFDAEHFTDVAE